MKDIEIAIKKLERDLKEAERELERAVTQSLSTYRKKLKRVNELFWALERLNYKKEN